MKGKRFIDLKGMRWHILENKKPDKIILETESYPKIKEEFLKSTVNAAIQSGVLKEMEDTHEK